jgi:translation initiation factor IF-3
MTMTKPQNYDMPLRRPSAVLLRPLDFDGLRRNFGVCFDENNLHQRTHGFRLRRPFTPFNAPRPENQRKQKINDEITAPELRVVDSKGQPLGILPKREALRIAQEQELDLVEIAPQAKPPVAKIIDYGKFSYEQQKREKQQKKAQVHSTLKEMRFKAGTDTHDFDFKTRHAREFLLEGHKVRATVMFRGREIVHIDIGQAMLQRFIDALADVSKIDQPMKQEGRLLAVTLAPDPTKAAKKKKDDKAEAKTKKAETEPSAEAATTQPPPTPDAEQA